MLFVLPQSLVTLDIEVLENNKQLKKPLSTVFYTLFLLQQGCVAKKVKE